MLRYALRRLLWSVPALLATSFVLFFVTTLAPSPAASPDFTAEHAATDAARRARFLDLPRFINLDPVDVRARAAQALGHIAAGDAVQKEAGKELVRLGGAVLPYILPELDALAPDARRRVAVALTPLADRMHLSAPTDRESPDSEVLFWTRLWDDRGLDFTGPVVSRAVGRMVEYGDDLREDDLVALDTFALPELLRGMRTTTNRVTLARLTYLANHAAGRGPIIDASVKADEARREVANWREWWFVYGSDFEALEGAQRTIAAVTDTRYGKWLLRIANGELGVSMLDGEPIADKLRASAPVTLLVSALAMLASFALAVPIGVLGVWRRGGAFDIASSVVLFALYAVPTFVVAEALRRLAAEGAPSLAAGRVTLAAASLAVGSLATLSRWQRAALLEVMSQDFIRTARAKGASPARILVVHTLRNALAPMVTIAGLHLPALLAGAFVVEEIFGLPGLGFETIRAIEAHDAPWLMAVLIPTTIAVTLGLVASDVAYAALDPRTREILAARQGSSTP